MRLPHADFAAQFRWAVLNLNAEKATIVKARQPTKHSTHLGVVDDGVRSGYYCAIHYVNERVSDEETMTNFDDFNATTADDSPFQGASSKVDPYKDKWNALSTPGKVAVGVVGVLIAIAMWRVIVGLAIGGAFLAILFVPYFIPTIIGFVRKHPSKLAIGAVNFLFGWTFVGWVVAFIWSLSGGGAQPQQQVIVTNNIVTGPQAPPPVAAGTYQVGDIQNGHRFNGAEWLPIQDQIIQPPPPPSV